MFHGVKSFICLHFLWFYNQKTLVVTAMWNKSSVTFINILTYLNKFFYKEAFLIDLLRFYIHFYNSFRTYKRTNKTRNTSDVYSNSTNKLVVIAFFMQIIYSIFIFADRSSLTNSCYTRNLMYNFEIPYAVFGRIENAVLT